MKMFQKYPTFTNAIENNAHLEPFSQKEFEEYFFFYMKEKRDDVEFFLSYIETFFSFNLKELLNKYPQELIFKETKTSNVNIKIIKKEIIINYEGKEYSYKKVLDFDLSEDFKSIIKYLMHKNLYETIRLIFLNYLR